MNTNTKRRAPRLRVAALVITLLAFGSFGARAGSTFGFNYWPAGYSCNVLKTANWTVANQDIVKADLDHMSSLGADVLRLVFWPQVSGYLLTPGSGPGGATFTSDFTQERSNLVTCWAIVPRAASRSLSVSETIISPLATDPPVTGSG